MNPELEKALFSFIESSLQQGVLVIKKPSKILFANNSFKSIVEKIQKSSFEKNPQLILNDLLNKISNIKFQRDKILISGITLSISKQEDRDTIFCALTDITRTARLETIRTEFVANLAHEIKTPLTTIKGCVETLKAYPQIKSKERREFLDAASRQSDRITEIFDMISLLTEIELTDEGLKKEYISVNDLLKSIVQDCSNIAKEHGSQIESKVSTQHMYANRVLLHQALMNLCENAIKHSHEGSLVKISAKPTIHQQIQLIVEDNGPGIPISHQSRIFERFYRIDHGRMRKGGAGSGLGLALVKHIILAHGGTIALESEINNGTSFTITLPTLEEDQKQLSLAD
jgi:two-component system phosphate regulon sensor histidine kinase PhoR